jgi:hypothetical protein
MHASHRTYNAASKPEAAVFAALSHLVLLIDEESREAQSFLLGSGTIFGHMTKTGRNGITRIAGRWLFRYHFRQSLGLSIADSRHCSRLDQPQFL